MTCRCGHHRLTHTYTRAANIGPCLAGNGCSCNEYRTPPPMPTDKIPHTHGGTDAPECTPYGIQCRPKDEAGDVA